MKKKVQYCEMCNFTSIWKDALQTHIQNFHDGVITHFCNDCDFTTDSINSLKQHKVVTHGAQRIFCPEDGCSYNAKWKADVKNMLYQFTKVSDTPVTNATIKLQKNGI